MAEKYHPQKGTQKMKILKIVLLVLVMVSLSSVNSPYAKSKAPKQKLYTAYNIWIVPNNNLYCINYKYGLFAVQILFFIVGKSSYYESISKDNN